MVLAALDGSLAISAVNLPFRPTGAHSEPFLRLGEQLGRLAGCLLGGSINRLRVDLWGIEESLAVPVTVAAVKGALTCFLGEAVNYVNAEKLAAARGIEVVRAMRPEPGDYPHLVGVTRRRRRRRGRRSPARCSASATRAWCASAASSSSSAPRGG